LAIKIVRFSEPVNQLRGSRRENALSKAQARA